MAGLLEMAARCAVFLERLSIASPAASRRGPRRSNLSVAEGRPGPRPAFGGGIELGEPPGRERGASARGQLLVVGELTSVTSMAPSSSPIRT